MLGAAQLASPPTYFFPPGPPVPPGLSPPPIVYCTILCLTRLRTCTFTQTYYPYRLIPSLASNTLCPLALVLEIERFETLTETIRHAQRKERFVLGAQGGHVAYATEMCDRAILNALDEDEDSLKKRTEGHHGAFVRARPDCIRKTSSHLTLLWFTYVSYVGIKTNKRVSFL